MFLYSQSRKGITMFDSFPFSKPGRRSEGRSNKSRQRHPGHHRRLLCETLETRTMLSGLSVFAQQAKFTASDGAASNEFGNAVAVGGNTMVATGGGAAYVFTESGSSWTQTAKLTASDGTSLRASSSAFSGLQIGDDCATLGERPAGIAEFPKKHEE